MYASVLIAFLLCITHQQIIKIPYSPGQYAYIPYANISVGDPAVTLSIGFNSEAEYTWVQTKECVNCGRIAYYSCQSSSKCKQIETTASSSIQYNSTDMKGIWTTDAFNFNQVIADIPFISVTEKINMYGGTYIDGLIGIALSSSNNPDSFIYAIESKKVAGTPIIGITSHPKYPYVTIGDYDQNVIKNKNDITWTKMKGSTKWNFEVKNIEYDEKNYGATRIEIRTADTDITVPELQYNDLLSKITKGAVCTKSVCVAKKSVYKKIKDIQIKYSDYIEVSIGYDYFTQVVEKYKEEGTKMVKFAVNIKKGSDSWAFGSNVLRLFYTIFDFQNQRLGVYYIGSPRRLSTAVIVLITILVVVVVVGVIIIILCWPAQSHKTPKRHVQR
jgi:Eukaryotic aspartyl protease